jgi:cell wall assembly regulator SMI1
MNDWNQLVETWGTTLQAVDRLGGHITLESARRTGIRHSEIWGLHVREPARAEDIERVETRLGIRLPVALAHVFLTCTSGIDFRWQLPRGFEGPEPFHGIFSGGFSLSLESLQEQEHIRREMAEGCFRDRNSPYDVVWHDKLAVMPVPNGDIIGIDLAEGHYGQVVYLSHDDGQGHGFVLGADFIDFLRRWTPLGCPGPEDWQWLPFTSDSTSMLEPESEVADRWRKLLGLEMR